MARRVARLVPSFDYKESKFYNSDGAPPEIARLRRNATSGLRKKFVSTISQTLAFSASLEDSVSDVKFTNTYRVPFPYRKHLAKEFKYVPIAVETIGTQVRDLDGNLKYDVSGSYGVNVFGYDFYKGCMERGFEKVKALGPVLGPYHPLIRENVEKIRMISGLDEVSFHMSGTEAVMQAVRLARYHTGRSHLVRFCGAYHGWWDGVQPGIGNQRQVNDVYTLKDLSDTALKVLDTRKDIACVLINPLQALHPNSDAASDASLVNSLRSAHFDREIYSNWLKRICEICNRRGIVLIFDEVFVGFRLGYRGAQEYFGVQADMVVYGKTLGGGLPVGVVCGRHHLMKRFRDDKPINVSFARGTFNSHPYVMGAMNEFLRRIEQREFQDIYQQSDELWNTRVKQLNHRLQEKGLPVKVVNMHSILTIVYTKPSRYNWMYQFYLRAEGLELSWVGTGRMIMSLNYSDDDFNQVIERMVKAAQKMHNDGWWWQSPKLTNKAIQKQIILDMLATRLPFLASFAQPLVQGPARTSIDNTVREGH
jgi:glutamate-1-semialdehyde 2,1-aminomutase